MAGPAVDLAAFSLLLAGPLLVLLKYHDYGLATPEVGLAALAILILAALLVLVARTLPSACRAALLAFLIVVFIDIHTDFELRRSVTAGLGLVLALLLWVVREHDTKIIAAAFATFVVATLVLPTEGPSNVITATTRPSSTASALPPIVHVILDEQIGTGHVPADVPGARALQADLSRFYGSHGFRLHPYAYSQYAHTYNSLGNLVNFAASDVDGAYVTPGQFGDDWLLRRGAYLLRLQERGYALTIYQSTHLDFCRVPGLRPAKCVTYPVTSLRPMHEVDVPVLQKTLFLLNATIHQSRTIAFAHKVYERTVRKRLAARGLPLPEWRWYEPPVGPLLVPEVLERLRADIMAGARGRAFIAHLMLPHYPYAFDRNCMPRQKVSDWRNHRVRLPDLRIYNTAESRSRHYALYLEQTRCLTKLLDELFTQLDSRGSLADALVVVHGDHGARIPLRFPEEEILRIGVLSESDFVDVFPTLFAVRGPDIEPGTSQEPASLSELLRHYFLGTPITVHERCNVFLTTDIRGSRLLRVTPRFCAQSHALTSIRASFN